MILKKRHYDLDKALVFYGFDHIWENSKMRKQIKSKVLDVSEAPYNRIVNGLFKITHIKKEDEQYVVNVKIKGKTRRYYWNSDAESLSDITSLSGVRTRNHDIRNKCSTIVYDYLKYYGIPEYMVKVNKVKVIGLDENL